VSAELAEALTISGSITSFLGLAEIRR